MIYKCRIVKPNVGQWFDVEASSEGEAALEHHYNYSNVGYAYVLELPENTRQQINFALVEVDGFGEFISRVYIKGIWRKGGIKLNRGEDYLITIARNLNWEHPAEDLLKPGWDGETDVWEQNK